MIITEQLTDPAVLAELGSRVKAHRVEARLTQAELAKQAGIGKRTVERLEAGEGTELLTLVRILRVLDRLSGFELLLPEIGPGPIAKLKARGRKPQRVRPSRNAEGSSEAEGDWTWGDS